MADFLFIITCDVVFSINKDEHIVHTLILFSMLPKSTQKEGAMDRFDFIIFNG
jgi:hypothetical protein